MKYGITLLLLAFFSTKANSQKLIELKDVSSHVGDSVSVFGKVYNASVLSQTEGSPTALEIGISSTQLFTVLIWGKDRGNFKYSPEQTLLNKELRATGKIELINGKPQMVVRSEEQIIMVLSGGGGASN